MILTTFPRPRYASAFSSFRALDRALAGPSVRGGWVDDAYRLSVDLPGVPAEAVNVSVAGRTLTIDVTTDDGSWSQRLRLPQTLDTEQVSASHVDGRLTVTVGKAAQPEARVISIDVTRPQAELPVADGEPAAEAPAE